MSFTVPVPGLPPLPQPNMKAAQQVLHTGSGTVRLVDDINKPGELSFSVTCGDKVYLTDASGSQVVRTSIGSGDRVRLDWIVPSTQPLPAGQYVCWLQGDGVSISRLLKVPSTPFNPAT